MKAYSDFDKIPFYRYGMIMADPPYKFDHWGKPNEKSAGGNYNLMTLEEIKAMPVERIAAPQAHLMLWWNTSMIFQAKEVLDAWGFKFVTMGFWVKTTKSHPIRPRIGTGHVLRECGEPFLIGSIGEPPTLDKGVPAVFFEPRKRGHSRKPDGAFETAERLSSPHSWKIELFSRTNRKGWDVFGNETGKFIDPVQPVQQ
jgi:N6-adenosine-specific RNA methylase IME4